jgi:ribose 5-phosphate isomerase B
VRVYLGSDHAGFELKQRLVEHIRGLGHEPVDCGPTSYDAEDDYPPYVLLAATRTAADPGSVGIVLGAAVRRAVSRDAVQCGRTARAQDRTAQRLRADR